MDRAESLPFDAPRCSGVKRPRQNRVTPFGTIEATSYKGALMGNRGDLHAPDGSLAKRWRSARWLSCVLDGGGWKAPMDSPGHNYPLFFHDEAVALAAGHRPCGECRPDALHAFISAWKRAQGVGSRVYVPLPEIDRELHWARTAELKRRAAASPDQMPDGAFVWYPGRSPAPLLYWGGVLWPWKHGGYDAPVARDELYGKGYRLTPMSMIGVLQSGYTLALDPALQQVAPAA